MHASNIAPPSAGCHRRTACGRTTHVPERAAASDQVLLGGGNSVFDGRGPAGIGKPRAIRRAASIACHQVRTCTSTSRRRSRQSTWGCRPRATSQRQPAGRGHEAGDCRAAVQGCEGGTQPRRPARSAHPQSRRMARRSQRNRGRFRGPQCTARPSDEQLAVIAAAYEINYALTYRLKRRAHAGQEIVVYMVDWAFD